MRNFNKDGYSFQWNTPAIQWTFLVAGRQKQLLPDAEQRRHCEE